MDKDQFEEAFATASELTGSEREAFLARFAEEHHDLIGRLRNLLDADADTDRTVGDAVVQSLARVELGYLTALLGMLLIAYAGLNLAGVRLSIGQQAQTIAVKNHRAPHCFLSCF